MKKIFKETQAYAGAEFGFNYGYPNAFASLTVDEDGNPTYAMYGVSEGSCHSRPEDIDFDDTVERVMGMILVHKTDDFRQMRDLLNPKYKQMAENIRKRHKEEVLEKAKKFDF